MIVPADKGNATVLMDRESYDEKMNTLLDDPVYGKLKRDPRNSAESKVDNTLKALNKEKKIDHRMYERLKPSHSKIPRIYGTPKVHKPEVPLRPIVPSIGSATYKVAKYLARVIGPLVGHTVHHVKDSRHFAESMKAERLQEDESMISFNVKSLFTNVPVDEALEIAKRRLEDETLNDRTPLDPPDVLRLLEMCLRTTYFSFRGVYYQQNDGAAMGSPMSPIIANLYMELALSTAPNPPRIWKRYVDDTYCIIKEGTADDFLTHLNSLRRTIQFTENHPVHDGEGGR